MSDLKVKNIRLSIILVALMIIIGFLLNMGNKDQDIDRSIIKITNTSEIDKVISTTLAEKTELTFDGSKWLVNSTFQADPMKIKLLFAAISQISIRRQLDGEMESIITRNFEKGHKIDFYSNDNLVRTLEVWGDPSNSLTYIRYKDIIYLVEIPGYKTNISGHLNISEATWRHPNIFHEMAWRNLAKIEIDFPFESEKNFSIIMGDDFFKIENLVATDTTRLIDYIDYLSLIEVDEYLSMNFSKDSMNVFQTIRVFDVGKNLFEMELLSTDSSSNEVFGLLNEKTFFRLSSEKITPLNKSINYFKP